MKFKNAVTIFAILILTSLGFAQSSAELTEFGRHNEARAQNRLKPLRWNNTLYQNAIDYANLWYRSGFCGSNAHSCGRGSAYYAQQGYPGRYAGDNFALVFAGTNVTNGWMDSSGHRANILNPGADEVGIALVEFPNPQNPGSMTVAFAFFGNSKGTPLTIFEPVSGRTPLVEPQERCQTACVSKSEITQDELITVTPKISNPDAKYIWLAHVLELHPNGSVANFETSDFYINAKPFAPSVTFSVAHVEPDQLYAFHLYCLDPSNKTYRCGTSDPFLVTKGSQVQKKIIMSVSMTPEDKGKTVKYKFRFECRFGNDALKNCKTNLQIAKKSGPSKKGLRTKKITTDKDGVVTYVITHNKKTEGGSEFEVSLSDPTSDQGVVELNVFDDLNFVVPK